MEPSLVRRATAVLLAAILAFVVARFASSMRGGLLSANLVLSPAVPGSVVVMAAALWLLWQYLGGRRWPRSTSEQRRALLRARPILGAAWRWALVASGLSLVALGLRKEGNKRDIFKLAKKLTRQRLVDPPRH